MKILSLLLLSSSLFFAHDAKASSQDKQLPLIQDIVRTSSQNHLPASFEQQFEKNSRKIRTAIDSFFSGTEEHAERVRLFDEAHTYGQSLFKESVDGTANSRDMALVHLSYAALMSKDTISRDTRNKIDYKNPQDILIQMNLNKEDERARLFNSDVLFLPIVSKTGHLTLDEINECYSQRIAIIGIPYGSQSENTFDAVTGSSPLDFANHDVDYAFDFTFGIITPYKIVLQNIYNDIKISDNKKTFNIPYFLVSHEYPYIQRHKDNSCNIIEYTLNYMKSIFIESTDEYDYTINCIINKKSGFQPYKEDGSFSTTFKHPTHRDDIIFPNWQPPAPHHKSMFVDFTLKSQPGETFQLSTTSYKQMFEAAVDLAKTLNIYGAELDIPEDITHFNMKDFIHTISKGLNDFNKAYGHFFDAV